MSKIVAGAAALAVTALLTLPGPAGAAEQRADGLRNAGAAASTELSSRRYWRRGYVARRAWGPRFGYARPYYRPYYAGYPYYRRPYGYWGSPYASYGYSPYYYSRPVASIGFGFGPRWGWGW